MNRAPRLAVLVAVLALPVGAAIASLALSDERPPPPPGPAVVRIGELLPETPDPPRETARPTGNERSTRAERPKPTRAEPPPPTRTVLPPPPPQLPPGNDDDADDGGDDGGDDG